MKKANVTYEEVAAYCDQNAAKGINPEKITCRQVIEALACNSSTSTVNELLKRWRHEHAHSVTSGIALNEGDLAAVYMAVKSVIASKCGERERELAARMQEANSRLEGIANENEALMNENGLLTEWKAYLEEQLAEAKRTITVLQGSLATIIGAAHESTYCREPSPLSDASDEAEPALDTAQRHMVSPLPPEAFGDSDQEPTTASGQAGLSFSTAAGNSNEGLKEQPHAQG